MSDLIQKWKDGDGPIGSAIFYADGSYRPAVFEKARGTISFGEVSMLLEDAGFSSYGEDQNGQMNCEVGLVRWGGGPWEGEGWIALEDHSGDLIWLLHLEESEPITQARYFPGLIEAVAYEYPTMAFFSIPPGQPHLATCSLEDE